MMKKGDKVSKEELLKNNWKHLCSFATCYAWGKGEDRVLWEPSTEKIVLVYKDRS